MFFFPHASISFLHLQILIWGGYAISVVIFALVGFSYVVGDISSCLTQLLGRLFFELLQGMVEDLVLQPP